ncbi:hypothetical protein ACROYT_G015134 [Oculina patagonica]
MESFSPQDLDVILTKFYAEVRKKDGSEYEPDSLRVMQASLDRYLRQKDYSASIISGREFKKSQETLNSKAKPLRYQGKGKWPNRAQPYSRGEEEIFWREGQLGSHSGLALTNINFKNLAEHLGFRGRQDHYYAYVEDFSIVEMADGGKCVQFEENPTKTRQGRLRNKTEVLRCKCGQPTAVIEIQCDFLKNGLNVDPNNLRIPVHCTSRSSLGQIHMFVVAKLKEAGQPRHKIIQVTGHARESSLDDYDQTSESERRQLSHIASGYTAPSSTSSAPVQASTSAVRSFNRPEPCQEALNAKENVPANPFTAPSHSVTMATKHLQQAPFQVFNQCVFNTNNEFSPDRSLQSQKRRKRHVIIYSDSN